MNGEYWEANLDLNQVLSAVARRPRMLAAGAILGLLAGLAWWLFVPRTYVAKTAFLPVASSGVGQGSDILRNLPFGLPSGANVFGGMTNSSEIYPDLLSSSRLLTSALNMPVPGGVSAHPMSFRERFGFSQGDSAVAVSRALKKIRKRLVVTLNKANGLVSLQFADRDPRVASAFLETILHGINDFNTSVRQSQAGGVRRFLEVRVEESKRELAEWEEALTDFKRRNLRYGNAPQLSLEEARLQRRVRLAEAIYSTLSQQWEISRIDEVRDTPTLTILEPPVVPALPSGVGPVVALLIGAFLGTALVIVGILAQSVITGRARLLSRAQPQKP